MAEVQRASVVDTLEALREAVDARCAASVAEVAHLVRLAQLYRVDEQQLLLVAAERYRQVGGDGTPQVGEFLIAEIAPLLRCSPDAALGRLADALNLVFRHPRLWAAVQSGSVEPWQARLVTRAAINAELDAAAADWVDERCARALETQPIGRVLRQVDGWILQADPQRAAERAEAEARRRHVTLSRIHDAHVSLFGQLDVGDGLALHAALDRTADALAAAGHVGDHSTMRATALGQLARLALGEATLPLEEPVGEAAPSEAAAADAESGTPAAVAVPSSPAQTGLVAGRRAILTVHLRPSLVPGLTDGDPLTDPWAVASIDGWGELLTDRLGAALAGCQVIVRPVIDLTNLAPVDSYAIPERMREAVCARNPVDVFPYGTRPSRSCDLDHTVPYQPGVAGQTRPENLGPLSRFTHRAKTFGGWIVRQVAPGVFEWTSPLGYQYVVTPFGTTMTARPLRRCPQGHAHEPPGSLGADDPGGGRLKEDAPPLDGVTRVGDMTRDLPDAPGADDLSAAQAAAGWPEDDAPPDPLEALEGWEFPGDVWHDLADPARPIMCSTLLN